MNIYAIDPIWTMIYIGLATASSLFYGLFAWGIFVNKDRRRTDPLFQRQNPASETQPQTQQIGFWELPTEKIIHQFWLNFIGVLIGWVAGWPLFTNIINSATKGCTITIDISSILLFFLAFIGIIGLLPTTIVGIVTSIRQLIENIAKFIRPNN